MVRTLFISLSALALAACGGLVDIGGNGLANGQPLDELELEEFDAVSLRGSDNVEIALGEAFDIRIEGDPEIVDLIEFEIRGGTLRIGRRSDRSINIGSDRATVFVTLPVLNGASVAGSGDMRITRAVSDRFELSIAGSGSIDIAALEAERAEFDIAGSGDLEAAGTVSDLEIGIAGSGDIDAPELQVQRAEIDIAGSGNVDITASERVDGNLIGSGDVRVRGEAECQSNSIGSGDMRCG
ncbi:head GIN domain-containing protein [Parasphingopyxis sp.]|uniref:head GIN domain-containing protein n=1 Tax=Parasphingopyxis sp. TaxID=1920299 RepID=UPI002639F3A6|nr:head GIN domain-containing protein [Parasphingopyxis sp.]